MNHEGRKLLAAVIGRDASLKDHVKKGDCKAIAAAVNGYMPKDMQISPVDVFQSLAGSPGFAMPEHNAEVLRARIDKVGVLHSARINVALRGAGGEGAIQAIVNELNLSADPTEHVTVADVTAAMELRIAPAPTDTAAGAAALVGRADLGG
jgi:hypothetical protein